MIKKIKVRLKGCGNEENCTCFLHEAYGFPYCLVLYDEDWLKIKNTEDVLKIQGNGACMDYIPVGEEKEYTIEVLE